MTLIASLKLIYEITFFMPSFPMLIIFLSL